MKSEQTKGSPALREQGKGAESTVKRPPASQLLHGRDPSVTSAPKTVVSVWGRSFQGEAGKGRKHKDRKNEGNEKENP